MNIGCGEDVSIRELAETVRETLGFEGDLVFDTSKPDGTPRKLLNIAKIRSLGWTPAYRFAKAFSTPTLGFCSRLTSGQLSRIPKKLVSQAGCETQ